MNLLVRLFSVLALTMTFVAWGNADPVKAEESVIATVSLSGVPVAVALTPDGQFAYVADVTNGRVRVVRLSDNTLETSITLGAGTDPSDVAVSADGTRLFVAQNTNNLATAGIAVINTSNNSLINTQRNLLTPTALAVSSGQVYIAQGDSNNVASIPENISNFDGSQLSNFSVTDAQDLAITPDGSSIYISITNSNQVKKYRRSDAAFISTISVGNAPKDLVITPDGSKVYVANKNSNTVSVIRTNDDTVISTVSVGRDPRGMSVSPDGSEIYVPNALDGTVSVIATASNTVTRILSVGGTPLDTAVSPSGDYVYVVDSTNAKLIVLSRPQSRITNQWQGKVSIECPNANPWTDELLETAKKVNPLNSGGDNIVGQFAQASAIQSLGSSGVEFSVGKSFVQTATAQLPSYGCNDYLINAGINQPIQFIAGGFTLQSDAHGFINTQDEVWHDVGSTTLFTNTAAFFHVVEFTRPGRYEIVITEAPDTTGLKVPTFGQKSVRFVVLVN